MGTGVTSIRENAQTIFERDLVRGHGALLAGGAGGDFPLLTLDERKQVAKSIVDAANSRKPFVVGTQDTNVSHSIELTRWAEEIGAYGGLLSATYYYQTNEETT